MSYIEERKMVTREKRLTSLSHFNGTLEQLLNETEGNEIKQRIRTFMQTYEDEIIAAIRVLSSIKSSAVIVHGVAGCSASALALAAKNQSNIFSTNLQERDTILGSDEKLRNAITKIYYELHPEVVFVIGSPVVAINNDDINSVIFELEDELGIKIISIYTDGFKTKTKVTGYDIILHGLLRNIVGKDDFDNADESEQNDDFINIISLSENKRSIKSLTQTLDDLKIAYNILPQFSSVKNIRKASQAKASVVLNAEEGEYFAQDLETAFKVPYLKTPSPIGFQDTADFILKIAKLFDSKKEEEAITYIEKREEEIRNKVKLKQFENKIFYYDGKLTLLPGFEKLLTALGGKISGFAINFVDLDNRTILSKLKSFGALTPVIIGNGQNFEKANALAKNHYDYYLSLNSSVSFAAEADTIPVSLSHFSIFGYEGILDIFSAISNAKIFETQKVTSGIYKDSWLKKSGSWYVKNETK